MSRVVRGPGRWQAAGHVTPATQSQSPRSCTRTSCGLDPVSSSVAAGLSKPLRPPSLPALEPRRRRLRAPAFQTHTVLPATRRRDPWPGRDLGVRGVERRVPRGPRRGRAGTGRRDTAPTASPFSGVGTVPPHPRRQAKPRAVAVPRGRTTVHGRMTSQRLSSPFPFGPTGSRFDPLSSGEARRRGAPRADKRGTVSPSGKGLERLAEKRVDRDLFSLRVGRLRDWSFFGRFRHPSGLRSTWNRSGLVSGL